MREYVEFELTEKKPKTNVYNVVSKSSGDVLGVIKWYGPWRQYVFFPEGMTIWSSSCIQEITSFIKTLMEERKNE